jgi:hypothetical protein
VRTCARASIDRLRARAGGQPALSSSVVTIHANLDCEARWSGLAPSRAVLERISLYGALLGALVEGTVEIWTPAAIDPARWLGEPMTFRVGTPPRADLVWANPAAKPANDRRLAHAVAALPGAKTITRVDELDLPGRWVAKVPWTAAGRDRCLGEGPPTPEQRTRLARLLAATGALVVEPWCDRVLDVGACASVDAAGLVTHHPPHGLLVDARGGFTGISVAPPALEPDELALLAERVAAAGAAIASTGYAGPFAVDAFAYRDGDARRFHAPVEINARYTFGWVARALAARHGSTTLGLAGPPPPGARVLIAPGADGVTAWCA